MLVTENKDYGCFLKAIIPTERKAQLAAITLIVGAAFAIFGIVHFVPQWTHLPNWSVNVSYMTQTQFALNSFAFSSLIIGSMVTLISTVVVVNLIKDKIMKRDLTTDTKSADSKPPKRYKPILYLGIAALATAVAIGLLIAAAHGLNNINDGPLTLPSGETIIAVSQSQIHSIFIFGLTGAAFSSLGIYALARLIHVYAKRAFNHNHQNKIN